MSYQTSPRQHFAFWSTLKEMAAKGACSASALAQERTKVARIGFLGLAPASASASRVESLRTGLRVLGYVEGRNIAIEFRWADSVAEMAQHAAELAA